MRIFEIITDWVADTKLMEMAYERKAILKKCVDLSYQIDTHLIKVLWFTNSNDVNHWCNELNVWLKLIDAMEYNRDKKLQGHQYYDALFIGNLGHGVGAMTRMVDKMIKRKEADPNALNGKTATAVYELVESFMHKICYDIANNKFVDIKDYL